MSIFVSANAVWAANTCTGATYYDSDNDTCIACPDGYDYNTNAGKTSINQCQIHCDAGTYVKIAASDYTQLEYIQTNGSQYINTGITSDGLGLKTMAEVEWQDTIASGEQAVIGVVGSGTYEVYFQPNKNGLYRGSNERADINMSITPNVRYVITSEMTTDMITHDINGTTSVVNKTLSSTNAKNITLFRHSTQYFLKAKVYHVKIWQNGGLVRDMIPARHNSNGVVGMYDTVNDVFYTNAGTGTFTAGSDIGGFGQCENVGVGYYAAASNVNFGGVGTRTACPIGTSTNGSDNASACTLCAGATYADSIASESCTVCPDGYDDNTTAGKTSETQCQISCPAGTWNGEYIALEYIHFDKTNYIDTGLKTNTDVKQANGRLWADVRMYPTGKNEEQIIVGGGHLWMGIDNNGPKIGYGAAAGDTRTTVDPYGGHCIYDLNVKNNTYTVYDIDNESYIVNLSSLNKGTDSSTAVIGVGSYQANTSKPVMDLYRIKIYNNDILVFDGIPARRSSDSEIGLYDTVSRTFKPKASGGNALTAGADIGGVGNQCTDVGTGYWAAASTTNYGSTGIRNACPNEYPLSDTGASAQTDCYASCTTTQVPHATVFTGGYYYGGTSTCVPADSNSCDTGYTYVATNNNVLAHCDGNTINLTWYNDSQSNGGTTIDVSGTNAISCTYGESMVIPNPPSARAGYTFGGWRLRQTQ